METLKKIYRIGHGPSSSHTMGPHRAAEQFKQRTPNANAYRVTLYGSLAATGKGHFTDKAIIDVLQPKATEIVWKPEETKPFHTNAMYFEALDANKNVIDKWLIYSIGGGALGDENTKLTREDIYEYNRISEILPYIERYGSSYWEYVASHEESDIWDYLNECWKIMQSTIEEGLQNEGVIPGGLYLKRKAAVYYIKAKSYKPSLQGRCLVTAYALATAEQNASGGLIVTGAQVLPSIIIILIIARFMKSFSNNPFVKGPLAFLRPVTTGLILVPVIQVIMFTLINPPETLSVLTTLEGWKELFNWIPIAGYAVFAFMLFKLKAHPILVIICGAVFGIVFF